MYSLCKYIHIPIVYLYINNLKYKNYETPRQSRQNQPIRSSEVGSRRAHKTRIVLVSVGFDATRKGVMELKKPSKVVFHRIG